MSWVSWVFGGGGGGEEGCGVIDAVSGVEEGFGGLRFAAWKAVERGSGSVVLVVVERRARRGRRNVGGRREVGRVG